MGFAPINSTLHPIGSGAHLQSAFSAGTQIVKNAQNFLTPKKLLTKAPIIHATAVVLAIGGSALSLVPLLHLVNENGAKLNHEFFADIAAKCPVLSGSYSVAAVMNELARMTKLIEKDATLFDGRTVSQHTSKIRAGGFEELSPTAQLVLCRGTACEDGGYVQFTKDTPTNFKGKAWVYRTLEEADTAIATGAVREGVIVLQDCFGASVTSIIATIEGMGCESTLAVVTDGYAEPSNILVVQKCRPATCDNEAFANIQTDDMLEIDLVRGRFNTSILAKDMKTRSKKHSATKVATFFA